MNVAEWIKIAERTSFNLRSQNPAQMRLAQDNHMLSTHAAEDAFAAARLFPLQLAS